MKTALPLFLILLLTASAGHTQCDPAFGSTINQSIAQFAATSTTPGLNHGWSFGDGYYGYGSTVSHNYAVPGVYVVKHYVTDSLNHCKDSVQQSVTIEFDIDCSAYFDYNYDSLLRKYQFTSLSTAGGGSILSSAWSVDGETIGFGAATTYQLSPGWHTVCLDIRTSAGCSSTACELLNGVSDTACHFKASFNATPITSPPHSIMFSASPATGTYSYFLDFGDGHSAYTSPIITHTYAAAGSYSAYLVVSDSMHDCSDTVWQTVYPVKSPAENCSVSYTYSASSGEPAQVHFIANGNQPDSSQLWTIRNSSSAQPVIINSSDPTYLFPASGVYYVCLSVVTTSGCTGSYCDTLTIDAGRAGTQQRMTPSFPNPVTGGIVSMRISLETEQRGQVSIYDLSGNLVYNGIRTGVPGGNTITIPVSNLRPGQYFLDIQFGTVKKRSIFRKL